MKKQKIRRYLPGVIPLDLTAENCSHIETGFLSEAGGTVTKVDIVNDLAPNGISYGCITVLRPHKDSMDIFGARIPMEDAESLMSNCTNKIKKYSYQLEHNGTRIDIHRYTLGLMLIEVDNTIPVSNIPDYCGKEVTDDLQYDEVCLSGMREALRKNKIRVKKD